jgi:hypothetical protein
MEPALGGLTGRVGFPVMIRCVGLVRLTSLTASAACAANRVAELSAPRPLRPTTRQLAGGQSVAWSVAFSTGEIAGIAGIEADLELVTLVMDVER